jgi:hypothetical protein
MGKTTTNTANRTKKKSTTEGAANRLPGKFIKATKASARDNGKFTFSASEISSAFAYGEVDFSAVYNVMGSYEDKVIMTIKGDTNKKYDVVLSPSRNRKTFYAECPRGLKMPSVGKPAYYEVVGLIFCVKGEVTYE